jgi:hypothetical protein
MQDYHYNRANGERVPASKMTIEEIRACLADGVNIHDHDSPSIREAEECVRKRLEIELIARGL